MKKSAYGKPLLISPTGNESIHKVEFSNELEIQDLVFNHPEVLPVSDIDESFNPLISICKELRTNAGYLDILMITPNGDLCIVEAKLWRNPEARRKVIGQILDYANELSKWNYEDLQREVNRNLGLKGNSLYELARQNNPQETLSEADFVDSVSRNLVRGKFLLLILGDGIREGAAGIADFLMNSAHLNFTFGMVELAVYELNQQQKIVIPRTITKTVDIQKIKFDFPVGVMPMAPSEQNVSENKEETNNKELDKRREFFKDFWMEFVAEMDLDDPGQMLPKPTQMQNIYIYPGAQKYAWISAYFAQSQQRVGVYFRCQNDQNGLELAQWLLQYKEEIAAELGSDGIIDFSENNLIGGFAVRLPILDVYSSEHRETIKAFFHKWINVFVNVIRPKIKEFENQKK